MSPRVPPGPGLHTEDICTRLSAHPCVDLCGCVNPGASFGNVVPLGMLDSSAFRERLGQVPRWKARQTEQVVNVYCIK